MTCRDSKFWNLKMHIGGGASRNFTGAGFGNFPNSCNMNSLNSRPKKRVPRSNWVFNVCYFSHGTCELF